MFNLKRTRAAATIGLAVAGLTFAAPAALASNPFNWWNGEKLAVVYSNSPLRSCAGSGCPVIANMPITKNMQAGGGWVTSLANQSPNAAWCYINYRNIVGWTGCWRLSDIPPLA